MAMTDPADREAIVTDRAQSTGHRTMYRKTALIEAHQWFKNGDHPGDLVGTKAVDWVKLAELRPDLIGDWNVVDDVPEEALYTRLEGLVVRFFRRPEPEFAGNKHHDVCGYMWHYHGWIDDLEGGHDVCPGDWIATGVHGEHWAIKPDVFAASYEVAVQP